MRDIDRGEADIDPELADPEVDALGKVRAAVGEKLAGDEPFGVAIGRAIHEAALYAGTHNLNLYDPTVARLLGVPFLATEVREESGDDTP
jgi:hypothetical protein